MMKIDKKTMEDIEKAFNSEIWYVDDAMIVHENDTDKRAYEYYKGKKEAFTYALDIVKVIGS